MSPQTINLVPTNIPTALFMTYGIADPFLPADIRVYEIPDLGIYLELTESGDVITTKTRSPG
jgi:hypothetical protein